MHSNNSSEDVISISETSVRRLLMRIDLFLREGVLTSLQRMRWKYHKSAGKSFDTDNFFFKKRMCSYFLAENVIRIWETPLTGLYWKEVWFRWIIFLKRSMFLPINRSSSKHIVNLMRRVLRPMEGFLKEVCFYFLAEDAICIFKILLTRVLKLMNLF